MPDFADFYFDYSGRVIAMKKEEPPDAKVEELAKRAFISHWANEEYPYEADWAAADESRKARWREIVKMILEAK